MAYTKQPWVDNVTPVDAARMLHVEDGIEMQVDAASVVPSAGTLVETRLLAGDAQPAFRVVGSGEIAWGPGGATAPDTHLWRSASNYLSTDCGLWVEKFLEVGGDLAMWGAGVAPGLKLHGSSGNPTISFGPGSSGVDTTLYRSAASFLKTDGGLIVTPKTGYIPGIRIVGAAGYEHALQLFKNNTDTQPTLLIEPNGNLSWGPGTGMDTSLYRSGAGWLETNNNFALTGATLWMTAILDIQRSATSRSIEIYEATDTHGRMNIWGSGKMEWGPGGAADFDTNLYRSAANQLSTDDAFAANLGSAAQISLGADGKLYFGSALDTSLYRLGADTLKTDDAFSASGSINAGYYIRANQGAGVAEVVLGYNGTSGAPWILFGTNGSWDTNLYRDSANVLATDDTLWVKGPVWAAGNVVVGENTTDAQPKVILYRGSQPGLAFGPGGSTAPDTNLYRGGANILKTDDDFYTTSGASIFSDRSVVVDFGLTGGKLYFGSVYDTSLERLAARRLRTTGNFKIGTDYSSAGTLTGLQLSQVNGTPTDPDCYDPQPGQIVVDTTASKLWVRVDTTWKWAQLN